MSESKKDDWRVLAWINRKASGKALELIDKSSGSTVGYIRVATLKKLLDGDVKGCPVKDNFANRGMSM